MMNIEEVKRPLQENGSRLIYQILDGLNWKQLTFKDISSNIDYITSYLIANKIENKKVLSLSMNCLTSFILESSLLSLGCNISFLDERILQSLEIKDEFDLIIKRTKEIINLALDLQTNIVTVQIGSIPTDNDSTHWHAVNTALSEIGQHAENYGCRLAVKASYDDYSTLKDFLKSLHTEGIKLIYDPASLITTNLDPIKGIYELHEYIVHTNLWDTRQTEEGRQIEVSIGDGIVPVEEYVSTLESTGYHGFYVINSKTMQYPVENIKKGKDFLDRF